MTTTSKQTKGGLFPEDTKVIEKPRVDKETKGLIVELLQDRTMTIERIADFTKVSPELVRSIKKQQGM